MDFDDNQVVNIVDVIHVLPPTFGSMAGDPTTVSAATSFLDGVINILDVIKVLPPVFGSTCP